MSKLEAGRQASRVGLGRPPAGAGAEPWPEGGRRPRARAGWAEEQPVWRRQGRSEFAVVGN